MKKYLLLLALPLLLSSCNFSKSVKVDLSTGISTTGDKLSCDDVFVTYNGKKISARTWVYGQNIQLNFRDMKGFELSDGKVFPDMDLYVADVKGDTIMSVRNMYSQYPDGIKMDQVDMSANLIMADPIHSDKDYKLIIFIYDTRGKGRFSLNYNFKVTRDENLKVETNNISLNEVYLFSGDRSSVIFDGNAKINEKVYFVIEGLNGLKEEGGMVFPGLSIKATGSDGSIILDNKDLFASTSETGISATDVKQKLLPNLTFSSSGFKNPVNCTIKLWDKKSDSKLVVNASLTVL